MTGNRGMAGRLLMLALSALLAGRPSFAADLAGVEHVSLVTYPEADCTKIHVYLKNAGRYPVFIETAQVGERVLKLDHADEAGVPARKTAATVHDDRGAPRRTDGNLQWRRALPNPVPPDAVADVTVSLWGIVKEVPVRIMVRGGQVLESLAKETPVKLRLTQIAFDPSDPNRIYVYCENRTDRDIVIDHLLVNTEKVDAFNAVPAGRSVAAGGKRCFIVRPTRKSAWGSYVGVGVVGQEGEKAMAVVRAVNIFPVGSWDGDTRAEMFFDSADMHKPMPDGDAVGVMDDPLAMPLDGILGRPFKACYDGGNPFRVGASWEENAKRIIRTMAALHERDASTPFYTHFGLPITEAYAFFGGLPDLVFMNPYTILFRAGGPEESGRMIRHARTWIDPRPVVSVPEAFGDSAEVGRDLAPDEVSFAVWNEIAEGAKGVRYYHRRGNPPGRGYADMPGVEARIARDALNLQLLKPFLRVGDTFNLAASDKDRVLCKSILCGDKGIAVIALNRDFAGGMETPSQWRRADDVRVSVAVPVGHAISQAFEVNQGFRPLQFTQEGGRAGFPIPSIRAVRLYLLLFQGDRQAGQESPGAQRRLDSDETRFMERPAASGEPILQLIAQYKAQASRIALPLLEPGLQLDDARVVEISLDMNALRQATLRDLARAKERAAALDTGKQERIRAALDKAYETLGEAVE